MKTKLKKIEQVIENSIAEELGIVAGEMLISINGKAVEDVFDYRYVIQEEYVGVLIQKLDGTECYYEIEKEETEDLGIVFDTGLMDEAKSCSNKCIFCFIDQLPKNMRDTLYFKDDDSRLSFLQGNYITMTNFKESDLRRIIFYHLSPINISVHTTDLELRQFMLKNPNSDNLIKYLDKLYQANIEMNFQIVLCNKVNDAKHLDKTIADLSQYMPKAKSLSVVPVGITKFRDNLFPFEPFTKEDCIKIIEQISGWQKKLKKEQDSNFVFASDEFYLQAELPLPSYASYEDFPQIENGVGMISLMEYEFLKAFKKSKRVPKAKKISIATGKASFDFINRISQTIMDRFPQVQIAVYPIENTFFGSLINVSGLLTGSDIIEQLRNRDLGEKLLLPANCLREQGLDPIFLDDITMTVLEEKLSIPTFAVKCNGYDFVKSILE